MLSLMMTLLFSKPFDCDYLASMSYRLMMIFSISFLFLYFPHFHHFHYFHFCLCEHSSISIIDIFIFFSLLSFLFQTFSRFLSKIFIFSRCEAFFSFELSRDFHWFSFLLLFRWCFIFFHICVISLRLIIFRLMKFGMITIISFLMPWKIAH